MKKGYVYILASKRNGTLYTGVTSDLQKRMYEHKNGTYGGFTKKYNVTNLVYYEVGNDVKTAIEREKYIKGKSRSFKLILIEENNPEWDDLSKSWFEQV